MLLAQKRRVKKPLKLGIFKQELLELYHKFKLEIEGLCQKHGVEINNWYSPSSIPQPKFVINGFGLDADQLFYEDDPPPARYRGRGKG